MSANAKWALSAVVDSLLASVVYAVVAVAIYVAVFVDVAGHGSLWQTLRHLHDITQEGQESTGAVRTIRVAAESKIPKVHEEKILAVFDAPDKDGMVTAAYVVPGAKDANPSPAIALPAVSKGFTVYGSSAAGPRLSRGGKPDR